MKTDFGYFLEFGTSNGPDIADYYRAKCSSAFGDDKRPCIINEACIINVIYAKNEDFGHYLDFGAPDGSHIAYDDVTKCFLTFGTGKRSCHIN